MFLPGIIVRFALMYLSYCVHCYLRLRRSLRYDPGCRFVTKRGDFVRTQRDRQIANFLYKNNVAYHYDVAFSSKGQQHIADFYLPQHRTYIDYFETDTDISHSDYMQKLQHYHNARKKVIALESGDSKNIVWHLKEKFSNIVGRSLR